MRQKERKTEESSAAVAQLSICENRDNVHSCRNSVIQSKESSKQAVLAISNDSSTNAIYREEEGKHRKYTFYNRTAL